MPFVQSFTEFETRMDCESIELRGRTLFRNGGQARGESILLDPPTEEFPRLRLMREFLMAKLDTEIGAFNSFKCACSEQAVLAVKFGNLPGPPADAPQRLHAGKKRIASLRSEVLAITKKLNNDSPHEQRALARQEAESQRLENIRTINSEIMQI